MSTPRILLVEDDAQLGAQIVSHFQRAGFDCVWAQDGDEARRAPVVRVQDQDYDLMLQQASGWMDFPVEVIDVELQHDEDDAISLSWHLTAVEKQHVLRAVSSPHNGRAFARLRELLRPERAELTGRPGDDAPPVPPTGPVRSAAAASPSAPGAR